MQEVDSKEAMRMVSELESKLQESVGECMALRDALEIRESTLAKLNTQIRTERITSEQIQKNLQRRAEVKSAPHPTHIHHTMHEHLESKRASARVHLLFSRAS